MQSRDKEVAPASASSHHQLDGFACTTGTAIAPVLPALRDGPDSILVGDLEAGMLEDLEAGMLVVAGTPIRRS